MSDADYVKRLIGIVRPRAKFVACTHSDEFIDPSTGPGGGFFYVNLYDETIDSNVIRTPRGLVMIHNTYLPSFAYNLLLCWLLGADPVRGLPVPDLARLLRHNFKKFYAEQLLHRINNMFSRAVFLETLLFEQACMVPVFRAQAADPGLSERAALGSQIMSSAVSFHELGHYHLGHDPRAWEASLGSFAAAVGPLYDRVRDTYPPAFVEEFQCDVLSVLSCLTQYGGTGDRAFCLRATAFAFAAFAVLSSLTKSAGASAADQRRTADDIDFGGIEKRHRDYTFTLGIDRDFVARARLVLELCDRLAGRDGQTVTDAPGPFPLPATVLDDLLAHVDGVMDCDDRNAREMSLLVAESLHDHPRGLEYLYLRSKTFRFGSQRNPDGSLKNPG